MPYMKAASLHGSAGLRTGANPSRRSGARWILAVAFLHLTSACLFGQADAAKPPTKAPLRLAIAEFAVSKETEPLRSEGRKLIDLLTSQLSSDREFELVERAALEKALKE